MIWPRPPSSCWTPVWYDLLISILWSRWAIWSSWCTYRWDIDRPYSHQLNIAISTLNVFFLLHLLILIIFLLILVGLFPCSQFLPDWLIATRFNFALINHFLHAIIIQLLNVDFLFSAAFTSNLPIKHSQSNNGQSNSNDHHEQY